MENNDDEYETCYKHLKGCKVKGIEPKRGSSSTVINVGKQNISKGRCIQKFKIKRDKERGIET